MLDILYLFFDFSFIESMFVTDDSSSLLLSEVDIELFVFIQ
jgi:hypothetical protein